MLSRNETSITVASITNAVDIILYSLSDASKRQYRHTYKLWNQFCKAQAIQASQLTASNVITFLESADVSHRTKQARLSHLRKLVQAVLAESPASLEAKSMNEQLKLLKLQRSSDERRARREKTSLSQAQVYDAFKVFNEDSRVHIRNRALLAILLYCGLRRAEIVELQWTDIDLESKQLTVHAGKGDKERTIPILGGFEHIQAWHAITGHRVYVFCGMSIGDKLNDDKPMHTNSVYKMTKHVQQVLGLSKLSPHDFRRTLIKGMINKNTPINVVKAIAGHENAETTMMYAEEKNAETLRTLAELPY